MSQSTSDMIDLVKRPKAISALAIFVLIGVVYHSAIIDLTTFWYNSDEYNYGLIIPFLVAYVMWNDPDRYFNPAFSPSLLAAPIAALSALLLFAGYYADMDVARYYALYLVCLALVAALGGVRAISAYFFPLLLLLISLPLPYLLLVMLTNKMQLISTDIGVWFIRQFGLPVLQTGNVIDMGHFKMLVEEACSGLRYMFPLLSIGLMLAYFYRAPLWAKTTVFLLAIPITIIMNSFRIAFTGWLIKNYGAESAEGFLHDFEGWVVFVVALATLIVSSWVLSFIIRDGLSFTDRIQFDVHSEHKLDLSGKLFDYTPALYAVIGFVLIGGALSLVAPNLQREQVNIERKTFDLFPFFLGERKVRTSTIDDEVLSVLKADDYFLGDYTQQGQIPINLYMAYYQAQRDGAVIHSPRDCLPGGGWQIEDLPVKEIPGIEGSINRAVMSLGQERRLVYYWVQQQGKSYSNEVVARAYLLYSSLFNGRTDGALVRIIRPIKADGLGVAEQEIEFFIQDFLGEMSNYIPN